MSNKVARAENFVVFVASRLEKHGKCRPSGGKWWQVAWQFAGIFQIFPLPLYPESPCIGTFRAARSAKEGIRQRKQPPPPYARERLARLAIAEYVTMFYRPLSPPPARLLHCHPTAAPIRIRGQGQHLYGQRPYIQGGTMLTSPAHPEP